MANANNEYQDAMVRRQVSVIRFRRGAAARFTEALDRTERAIAGRIRAFVDEEGVGGVFGNRGRIRALRAMLREVRELRTKRADEAAASLSKELDGFIEDEIGFNTKAYKAAMPFEEAALSAISLEEARRTARRVTFGGQTIDDVLKGFKEQDADRIVNTITQSYNDGADADEIVRRVRGSADAGRVDGVTAISRRRATTMVNTVVVAAGDATREAVWRENDDVVVGLKWTAVLDGRTSAICQARDGRVAMFDPDEEPPGGAPVLTPNGARPPAHPNCRSIMVPVVDGVAAIGDRTTITDTRTRRKREIDFRAMARRQGRSIQAVRRDWAKANIGIVPEETRFGDWLKRQPAAFQDDVLGPSRGALFRRGELPLERFVDESGRRYTLDELRARHGDAFRAANLDEAG